MIDDKNDFEACDALYEADGIITRTTKLYAIVEFDFRPELDMALDLDIKLDKLGEIKAGLIGEWVKVKSGIYENRFMGT